jgi:hydroxymethylbilane synthase
MESPLTVRIGTRGSSLALVQATIVRDALNAAGLESTLTIIATEGDRRAPNTAWGEGAFVTAIEAALAGSEIDVAVHSAKDLPTDEDPRLTIAAFLERAPSGDVLVLPSGRAATSLDDLPLGARVGTDSPRRTAFLRAIRPDLAMHPLHGNVDTRLRRLDEGRSDALVLAEAGLTRLGRTDRISFRLPPRVVPPAPGQGALAVQVRSDDRATFDAIARLDHRPTRVAVEAERALLAASGGGCRAPLGALGRVHGNELELLGGFARPDGSVAVTARRSASIGDPGLVDSVLGDLAAAAAAAAVAAGSPKVLVTRSADQAAALLLSLVDRGLAPISVPAIEFEPADDGLAPAIGRLAEFDWVVVTSANAARAVAATADRLGQSLSASGVAAPRWAAVGVATARALRAVGVQVALRPARATGAALANALPLEGGERILVPRSDLADDGLIEALAARRASVEPVIAYRTIEGPPTSVPLLEAALDDGGPIAVILTSGSTARGLLVLAERIGASDRVRSLPAICIGPTTAEAARGLGFPIAAEATGQGLTAIADATAGYLRPHQEES